MVGRECGLSFFEEGKAVYKLFTRSIARSKHQLNAAVNIVNNL